MRVKTCTRCGQAKPLCQFPPIRRSDPDTLQAWCRSCFADANHNNYQRNVERERARLYRNTARRRAESQRRAIDYLRTHPCVDCEENDIVVLQFDHLRDKSFDVSVMVSAGVSWDRIAAEIAKCEVRCANCHRRKTVERLLARAATRSAGRVVRARPVQLQLAAAISIRTCRVCRQPKPLTEFPFRSIKEDTRHWICLSCQRVMSAAWYARKSDRPVRTIRPRGTARRSDLEAQVFAYLIDHPCVDCREADTVVLDFDHVRDKLADVSTLVTLRRPWTEVKAEIDKCEVRCANCHARRTARDLANYKVRAV